MNKLVSTFRALYRLFGFTGYTILWIIGFYIVKHEAKESLPAGILWRRKWHKMMLPFVGIRIKLYGLENLTRKPVIYVGNHRSYIDPVIASRYAESVVISKSEVAGWPLIGKGITITGVVFVKRDDKQSRSNTLLAMESLLKGGVSILVFPEGTTTRAPGFLPFRPRTFQLAAELGIPVIPLAIEYEDPEDAWIGDDTFLRHFFQTFGKRRINIHLSIGPAMMHSDGELLMNMVHDWIEKELHTLNKWVQKNDK